jgi:2-dehydropantoate 2-reductase
MRLVILGAGAIGGVVGAHLARAGCAVLVLARGAHLTAIRERGLRVERPDGSWICHPDVADPREPIAWRDDDVLVVATKTQDVAGALADVAPPAHVPIACMTNGVEAERIALRQVRDVYAVCVVMPATHLVPGVVQVWAAPVPGLFDIGRYPDGTGAHADAIAGELIAAGFDCQTRTTIMKWKRAKLISNLANGIEALCGPGTRGSQLAEGARDEARAVFFAANLAIASSAEEAARRGGFLSQPIAGSTRGGGSTWQSLARGQHALETDYLNGEIALQGRIHGVPTPINEALQHIAADAARAGITPGSMPMDELVARVASHAH